MKAHYVVFVTVFAAALASKDQATPTEKVVQLLEDLQNRVQSEGMEEAKTYDKFACFCRDTTNEKTKAISDNTVLAEQLTSDIESLTSQRLAHDESIEETSAEMARDKASQEELTEIRKAANEVYLKNDADVVGAIGAIDQALQKLKSSKPKFAGLQILKKNVMQAAFLAEALGLSKSAKKLTSLLAQTPTDSATIEANSAAMEETRASEAADMTATAEGTDNDSRLSQGEKDSYAFHSDSVIETLEKLRIQFTNEKTDNDQAERDSLHAYNMDFQELDNQIAKAAAAIEKSKAAKAECQEGIAANQAELTTANAELITDRQYLRDMTAECESKAEMWDQRSQARSAELAALAQATAVLKGTALQRAETTDSQREDTRQEKTKDEKRGYEEATSFLQVPEDARQRAVDLLRKDARKLRVKEMAALAESLEGGDPFAKVKLLIQQLLDRLLSESQTEAEQHGWCETQKTENEEGRNAKKGEIRYLNAVMEELFARNTTLTENIDTLTAEIRELARDMKEMQSIRNTEKKDNAKTVSEGKDGIEAVELATKILKKYYREAKRAQGSFDKGEEITYERYADGSQRAPKGAADSVVSGKTAKDRAKAADEKPEDMPDAGFDTGYSGATAHAGGIIDMLEVILSDFQRTVSDTEALEAKQQALFVDAERENKQATAEKEAQVTAFTEERSDVTYKYEMAFDKLQDEVDHLDMLVADWTKLMASCEYQGEDYATRVARREAELQGLKDALAILEGTDFTGPFKALPNPAATAPENMPEALVSVSRTRHLRGVA